MLTAIYHIMIGIVNKLFKSLNSNSQKKYSDFVLKVNKYEETVAVLSDLELKEKTTFFKKQLSDNHIIENILPEAFAVVREVAKRTVGMRHFDVQLIGGKVLHEGKIAEMKTGEGKTLVATLAAYVNALDNKAVHIITVNDYLAKRDSEWMGAIYNFLGLTVGCVTSETNHNIRPSQYECDVVYATNNEIGFDYLRDNLKNDYDTLCFKKDAFAIVDEVDSILIDVFGYVSVVIIALAASIRLPVFFLLILLTLLIINCGSKISPITPVEEIKISLFLHLIKFARKLT